MAIDNFEVQPYPLWAVLVVTPEYSAVAMRVVGWKATGDGIQPVLALGARTMVMGPDRHVEFFESLVEAQLHGPACAEKARRRDAAEAAKGQR